MNLNRAKALLSGKGIPFHTEEYGCEADFWKHILLFPYTKNAADCKVITIVINSNNKHKHLELQFVKTEEDYTFRELWFGNYSFEALDYEPDILEDTILSHIEDVMSGDLAAFAINDLNKKQWIGDGLYEKNGGYAEKLRRDALKPKSWAQKIRNMKLQYEFYDWDNYEKIIK